MLLLSLILQHHLNQCGLWMPQMILQLEQLQPKLVGLPHIQSNIELEGKTFKTQKVAKESCKTHIRKLEAGFTTTDSASLLLSQTGNL
jgi:hypothetical protein